MNHLAKVEALPSREAMRYRDVRAAMPRLAETLSPEDLLAQSMPDASPGKWHLGHTSWFFEAMILARQDGYEPVDPRLQTLFNSYYEALGERVARPERRLITRPSVAEVLAYRAEIDRRMLKRLEEGLEPGVETYLFELGLHHDQQHQELFLSDLLHLMSRSPLDPAAYPEEPRPAGRRPPREGLSDWVAFDGGLVDVGADDAGFAFDNEGPRHRVWLEPYELASGLVTNGDWLRFIDDAGYERHELWLSDGWAAVKAEGWTAPAYWRREADGWSVMTLAGRVSVDPDRPVRHVSFYEADAYARWAGARLPTEAEWEHAATAAGDRVADLFGEVWQWTASAYAPYPGFAPTPGTASEYNGKFMANQVVLRGSAFATPRGHERASYRNFYYPHQRWAFTGVRLARNAAAGDAAFARELRDGLTRTPKRTSPKWFYDARGSELFEQITRLPEYYPTRQELGLLRAAAPALAEAMGPGAVLVEYGSGASEKTRLVLDAARDLAAYVPIDISPSALEGAETRLAAAYPGLKVLPVVGDFLSLEWLPDDTPAGRRVGFFPGSTIGNLEADEQVAFMRSARALLGEGAMFILGVDLIKDERTLVAAYDDAQGVTAAFNLNLIARMRDDLGLAVDPADFRHVALWNPDRARIEMHLEAVRPLAFRIDGAEVRFEAGERLHTESSHKFDGAMIERLAQASGWRLDRVIESEAPKVALALLRA
ncbi:ergothioneine biosynthesis protein EgtB [Brevundimonas balnearis]|uniref:Ergothioneine biosynthesis protein EgtB n=1 Tax=Brevundimonas balnearis TaxID=1572858 RepID=A0ABV6R103_9CAUL